MTDTKWTPGPWKWRTSNSWRRLKRDDRGISQSVLEPYVCSGGQPDISISDEDMHLIAAAPEMYEALELEDGLIVKAQSILTDFLIPNSGFSAEQTIDRLLGLLDGPEQRKAQDCARAALAKSRGETQ